MIVFSCFYHLSYSLVVTLVGKCWGRERERAVDIYVHVYCKRLENSLVGHRVGFGRSLLDDSFICSLSSSCKHLL